MAFSIRSFFGKTQSPEGDSQKNAATLEAAPPRAQGGGENPFTSSLLFKTVNPGEPLGQPVNATFQSPFSPQGSPQNGALTVSDILPLLPVDVARATSIPPNQPLHIPEEVLEHALRTGNPSVPLFEVYRVCPALFQTPISPQDPRQIPLPQNKIGHLLGRNGGPPNAGGLPPIKDALSGSPFGNSPFTAAAPNNPPPADPSSLFTASPFMMAGSASASASPFAAAGGQPQEAASPFGANTSPFGAPSPAAPNSPFSAPASPAPQQSSPFGSSPFEMPKAAEPPATSPFGAQTAAFPAMPAAETSQAPTSGFNPFSTAQTTTGSMSPPPLPEQFSSPFSQQSAATGAQAPSAFTPSPFGAATPLEAPASPFGMPAAPSFKAPEEAPRPQEASPFGASPFGTQSTPSGEQPPMQAFSPAHPAEGMSSPFGASPFGTSQEQNAPAPTSPFGFGVQAPAEPAPSPAAGSPFGFSPMPPQEASPTPVEPSASPYGSSPFATPTSAAGPAPSPFAFGPPSEPAPANPALAPSPFAAQTEHASAAPSPFGQFTAPSSAPTETVQPPSAPTFSGASPFGSPNPMAGPSVQPTPTEPAPSPVSGPAFGAPPYGAAVPSPAFSPFAESPATPPPLQPPARLTGNPFGQAAEMPVGPEPAPSPFNFSAPAQPVTPPAPAESPSFGSPASGAFPPAPSAYTPPPVEPQPTAPAGMPAPFLKILSIGKTQTPAPASPPSAPAPAPFPFGEPMAPKESPAPAAILPPGASLLPPQAPPTPPPLSPPAPAPVEASSDANSIRLSLVSALKNCTAQDLGINPELIPAWIQVSLPLAAISQQLATGRVRVGLGLIVDGLEAGYRSVLANARPGIEIELPATEVFHALPAGSAPAPASPVPTPEPPRMPEAFDPFASVSRQPETKAPASVDPFTAVSAPVETSLSSDWASAPKPVAPRETPPPPVIADVPMPVRTVSRDANRDMLLRALLQFSGDLDTSTVIRLTAEQPGVAAVVCLLDGQEVSSAGGGSPDADKFRHQAAKLLNHLQPIIALTGIEGTETFSMKSDAYIVTFSFQGPTTLCVLHEPSAADRGLAERITLISREVAQMLKETPPFA